MNVERCIVVQLNAQYIPIGDELCTLSQFIGSMIRKLSFAPIDYKSWKEMTIKKIGDVGCSWGKKILLFKNNFTFFYCLLMVIY